MRPNLFLISLLVTAVSAGVTRTPTTTTIPATSQDTTPSPTTVTTVTSSTTTTAATETKKEEEVLEEEDIQVGVNGWLAAPTQAPSTTTEPTPKQDKPGICESPKGFGIKCMTRIDQCQDDHTCPGATKCCLVGECGLLCVKPKPTSADTKAATKEGAKKNKKDGAKDANKQEADQQEAEETTVVETMIKENKQEENEEQGKEEGITDTEESVDTAEGHESKAEVTPKEPAQGTPSGEEENTTTAAPTEESI